MIGAAVGMLLISRNLKKSDLNDYFRSIVFMLPTHSNSYSYFLPSSPFHRRLQSDSVFGGILFAGNSSTGLIGIEASRGQVLTGNGSLVRDFNEKLKLGIEVFGGVTNDFNLSRGQLEAQMGGSYAVRDDFAFTFGVLAGRFPASPRVGIHVGFAYDFK